MSMMIIFARRGRKENEIKKITATNCTEITAITDDDNDKLTKKKNMTMMIMIMMMLMKIHSMLEKYN